jgi:5-methyltetrahydropteroyltriglutamate--homocysteine methyltransferase
MKRALEGYWRGELDGAALKEAAREVCLQGWRRQQEAGIDLAACNDFSLYDHVLDAACLVGAVPPRFDIHEARISTDTLFAMARGARALEMTKWFDTNYHHLVPELGPRTAFRLASDKPFLEFQEARAAGVRAKPILLGPLTFLALSKPAAEAPAGWNRLTLLPPLLVVYAEVLQRLDRLGAEWVQLDEPALALDLPVEVQRAYPRAYEALRAAAPRLQLLVATYFGPLGANLPAFLQLPVAGLHVDAVRGRAELPALLDRLPRGRALSVGIVDGRNVWRTDLADAWAQLERARAAVGTERLLIAPSCSLLHVPWSLRAEEKLPEPLRRRLAFADEKLAELATLARAMRGLPEGAAIADSRPEVRPPPGRPTPLVALAAEGDPGGALARRMAHSARRQLQRQRLHLPLFPTTTIGSFPQTDAVRATRARWRAGELDGAAYEQAIEQETAAGIAVQEAVGLDVFIHGELERTDMVEYFAEQLEGFAVTRQGWVQSYGSRYVRPPILYGPVRRRGQMTLRWARFAQSLTSRPVKGMLTGPVTILKWSFPRQDQPLARSCAEIALAIRDETTDLERAGIAVIQIDEPALREGLPLRAAERADYLAWAVGCFRLAAGGASPAAQVHTHMCYAEFADILPAVIAMDADVLTIEAARSGPEAVAPFATAGYPNEIGPGVWDIHSPAVPTAAEMVERLQRAVAAGLAAERLWVNPDCGLKTRSWQEVEPALRHLVAAARQLRDSR